MSINIILAFTILLIINETGVNQCPEISPRVQNVVNNITNQDELTERWHVAYNTMGIGNIKAEDFNVIQNSEICAFFNDRYSEAMEETVLLPGFDDKTYNFGFFEITIGESPVYITIMTPARIEGMINHGYTSVGFFDHNLELKFAYSY